VKALTGVAAFFVGRSAGRLVQVRQEPRAVIDGDAPEIRGTRIRLHGIDGTASGRSSVDR